MARTIVGIVVASVVLYFWGFVVWGLVPFQQFVWKAAKDDRAAGAALAEQFPERGAYFVPSATHDEQTAEELYGRGPIAMVHMISLTGRPMADASIMVKGFFLNVAGVVLIAWLLRVAALPTYSRRLLLVFVAGLTATVLIDFGDAVWWGTSWIWKLYQGFYSLSAYVVAGSVLAGFIKPAPPKAAA
jgi:hypothetical protein